MRLIVLGVGVGGIRGRGVGVAVVSSGLGFLRCGRVVMGADADSGSPAGKGQVNEREERGEGTG